MAYGSTTHKARRHLSTLPPIPPAPRDVGKWGEDIAGEYLESQGYTILERNWRDGRHGELDFICDAPGHDTGVAVEVKTRRAFSSVPAYGAISRKKLHRIRQLYAQWLNEHPSRRSVKNVCIDALTLDVSPSGWLHLYHMRNVS